MSQQREARTDAGTRHKNGMETFNRIAPDVSLGQDPQEFGFASLNDCSDERALAVC